MRDGTTFEVFIAEEVVEVIAGKVEGCAGCAVGGIIILISTV